MNLAEVRQLLEKPASEIFDADDPTIYRALAKACHPDAVSDSEKPEAERLFEILQQRVDEFSNPLGKIKSKEIEYPLKRRLGKGDVSEVYLADSPDGPVVLKRSVSKEANKFLDTEAKILMDLRGKSGDRKYKEYLPKPIQVFLENGLLVAEQEYVPGYHTVNEILEKHKDGVEPRHVAWMFKRLLAILGFVHHYNYIHCAVLPQHVPADHSCKLISWCTAVRQGQNLTLIPAAYKSWYPDSEIRKLSAVSAGLDIYLAAATMKLLNGKREDLMPAQMRAFLKSCMFPSPHLRPQDAWNLHDEFDALLRKVFGKPKFVQLEM
jgi:hypothetical protein